MKKHLSIAVFGLGLFMATIIGVSRTENVSATKMSIRVTPKTYNLTLEPGKTYTEEFEVRNDGDMATSYFTEVKPYQVDDSEEAKYSAVYDVKNGYTEIIDWINVIEGKEATIEPGESATVKFSITVPMDAPGGGQYATPLVTTKQNVESNSKGASIGQNLSIGPVIYAKVNGATRTDGKIISNDTNGFLFNPPISANVTVKNEGNVHTDMIHTMKVFPIFSGESIYSNEDNPSRAVILPNTTRYNSISWTTEQGAPSIGVFKVQSEVKIFDEVSKIEKIVIICPMWVLILVIIFLLALIFWLISRAKSRKKAEA